MSDEVNPVVNDAARLLQIYEPLAKRYVPDIYLRILSLMLKAGYARSNQCELLDLESKNFFKAMDVLKELGLVHIDHWETNVHGPASAIWILGKGIDAKKPPLKHSTVIKKQSEARTKTKREASQHVPKIEPAVMPGIVKMGLWNL